MRSFLGLCSYSRNFIKNFAKTTNSLYQLLKGESSRSKRINIWNKDLTSGFQNIKYLLQTDTSKYLPSPNKQFILTTDGSSIAIGGILFKISDNGQEVLVYCFSHKLSHITRSTIRLQT